MTIQHVTGALVDFARAAEQLRAGKLKDFHEGGYGIGRSVSAGMKAVLQPPKAPEVR
jgi:hypothetical protein